MRWPPATHSGAPAHRPLPSPSRSKARRSQSEDDEWRPPRPGLYSAREFNKMARSRDRGTKKQPGVSLCKKKNKKTTENNNNNTRFGVLLFRNISGCSPDTTRSEKLFSVKQRRVRSWSTQHWASQILVLFFWRSRTALSDEHVQHVVHIYIYNIN